MRILPLFLLTLAYCGYCCAEGRSYGEVAAERVAIRTEPSTTANSRVVGYLKNNDRVEILAQTNSVETFQGKTGPWYKIPSNIVAEDHWIFGGFVKLLGNKNPTSTTNPSTTINIEITKGKIKAERIHVRSRPWISEANTLEELKRGAAIEVIGRTSYKSRLANTEGHWLKLAATTKMRERWIYGPFTDIKNTQNIKIYREQLPTTYKIEIKKSPFIGSDPSEVQYVLKNFDKPKSDPSTTKKIRASTEKEDRLMTKLTFETISESGLENVGDVTTLPPFKTLDFDSVNGIFVIKSGVIEQENNLKMGIIVGYPISKADDFIPVKIMTIATWKEPGTFLHHRILAGYDLGNIDEDGLGRELLIASIANSDDDSSLELVLRDKYGRSEQFIIIDTDPRDGYIQAATLPIG